MAARRAVDDTEPLEPTLLLALSWRAAPGGEGTGGELLAALFGRDLGGELYSRWERVGMLVRRLRTGYRRTKKLM